MNGDAVGGRVDAADDEADLLFHRGGKRAITHDGGIHPQLRSYDVRGGAEGFEKMGKRAEILFDCGINFAQAGTGLLLLDFRDKWHAPLLRTSIVMLSMEIRKMRLVSFR